MARWKEEVTLLKEEMRRIEVFFLWEKNHWLQRASARTFETEAEREGWAACAKRQAALRSELVVAFKSLWRTIPESGDSEELIQK